MVADTAPVVTEASAVIAPVSTSIFTVSVFVVVLTLSSYPVPEKFSEPVILIV